jgi:hypothetical protein
VWYPTKPLLVGDSGDEFKSQLKKIQQWAAEDRGKDSREKRRGCTG